jgi:ATP-dependent DNA helicase RecQ
MARAGAHVEEEAERVSPLVLDVLKRYWGYDALRPLQGEAIAASMAGRDSLLVLPTGGGKSLCFQVPAVLAKGLTIVVSPLISLMKDQVDGLRLAGYPAAALHSGVSAEEAQSVRAQARAGDLRLLYVAPERLLTPSFMSWVAKLYDTADGLASFAIDEAHCISQWGHDFRPEYRRLAELREAFPRTPVHAYTATATPRVREDIVAQLRLRNAAVLVGRFDRPNLTYRIQQRTDLVGQILSIIKRHKDAGVIIYCISRKDTEQVAADLNASRVKAAAYHAGLAPAQRERVQDDFIHERVNVVAATVAFGMGIDRSDVRCVIHAAMPKTVEHYQQETGRAGRDGLPSECVLLTSPADGVRWQKLMQRSAAESDADPQSIAMGLRIQQELLQEMQRLAGAARCRHQALTEYFGQEYVAPVGVPKGCGACDVCLGDMEEVPEGLTIAQKIISCVYRVGQNSGAVHVAEVLRGSRAQRILERGHDRVSTFGLLAGTGKDAITGYIQQLIDQGALIQTAGEYPVLTLSPASSEVLKGARRVALWRPRGTAEGAAVPAHASVGMRVAQGPPLPAEEQAMFESLRGLRRRIADDRKVPPYVVFSDATLEELCRIRPTTPEVMSTVRGIGRLKLADLGGIFSAHIAAYCHEHGLETDKMGADKARAAPSGAKSPS